VRASVVTGCDAPPVLELGEQVLDLVALPIQRNVVGVWNFAAATGRDALLDAPGFQFLAEPYAVLSTIGDQVSV
jgi:hypothetical protein